MSGFGGKADIARMHCNVRFWPKADIQTSDFDLDQIQGRRTQTIVNNGLAFLKNRRPSQ
jgi:hypothetical protein